MTAHSLYTVLSKVTAHSVRLVLSVLTIHSDNTVLSQLPVHSPWTVLSDCTATLSGFGSLFYTWPTRVERFSHLWRSRSWRRVPSYSMAHTRCRTVLSSVTAHS